jgi:hypothetical protein
MRKKVGVLGEKLTITKELNCKRQFAFINLMHYSDTSSHNNADTFRL